MELVRSPTLARYRKMPPFTAMTTQVTCILPEDAPAWVCRRRLQRVFDGIERHLTRFADASELNRLCAAGSGTVSPALFRALTTSLRAWRRTGGLFDPRIRAHLEALGYTAGLVFGQGVPHLRGRPSPDVRWLPHVAHGPWLTVQWTRGPCSAGRARRPHRLVLSGGQRLDLGGIGKGLAVRYAARTLRACLRSRAAVGPRTFGLCGTAGIDAPGFLVDAGGDIWAEGLGPDGRGWQVGLAGPGDPDHAMLSLRVANRAVCTSGRGRRAWLINGQSVHHLIDPRTGRPADAALWSVTVVGRDPAWAEVWSKALFVSGASGGAALAEARGLAAIFVRADGRVAVSPAGRRYVDGGLAIGP